MSAAGEVIGAPGTPPRGGSPAEGRVRYPDSDHDERGLAGSR
jgi:hypothetical protein